MLERLADLPEVRSHVEGLRHWDCAIRGEDAGRSELRAAAAATDGGLVLEGYGAVFDSDSLPIWGMFTERIKRGAFRKVLKTNPDVRLLVNHEGLPFARTASGTMQVAEKPEGLWHRAELDVADNEAASLYRKVDRGDVSQMSFAFRVAKGGDEWDCPCGDPLGWECECLNYEVIRTITEVSDLPEVSVVTFPAYPASSVQTVARQSEAAGERAAQASGEDQREMAPDGDSPTANPAGDPNAANAIRVFADSIWEHNNVAGNPRAAGS